MKSELRYYMNYLRAFATSYFICIGISALAQDTGRPTKNIISSSGADTWTATDDLGRVIKPENYPSVRKDKYVGIFYFVWQGAHGYDQHRGGTPDGGIMAKTAQDTFSPYDISRLLKANPLDPDYGPVNAFHYWGEPFFGYYLADDEWVIRKHAQMLSDAGVDVIILDATNAAIYLPQVTKIATVYAKLRAEGMSTPAIAIIVNTAPKQTVDKLYNEIYSKGLFKDLWFNWKGKPLLLCPPEALDSTTAAFFSTRQSWAWSKGQKWFGNGHDKWPWLDHYPQAYGWHEAKDQPEQITVSIAQHPMSNIGRSFHDGKEPPVPSSEKGLYFSEQWKRALEVDPEFVFVTGWNEWVAMRFNNGASRYFLGKTIKKGETYFVDLYNAEFSRDAEPENGQTKDNYYYQLVDNIRKFKGVRKPVIQPGDHTIAVDGRFSDWEKVEAIYKDDEGDTFHRKHPGWGRIKEYVNHTGRNDIVECRVASDKTNVYFYVRTSEKISNWKMSNWMELSIGVEGSTRTPWEGFQYQVNAKVISNKKSTLSGFKKDGSCRQLKAINYRVGNDEMELSIPLKQLDIKDTRNLKLLFKWADNAALEGDPMHWMDRGDTAPNARFKYNYTKKSSY